MTKHVVAALLLACLAAGCGGAKHATSTVTPQTATRGNAIAIDPPTAAPRFLLRDQSGSLVGPQLYRGNWTVVTFLYTHCPDVCPLIASRLAAAQRQAPDLRVIAVSVDPKRDTRAAIRTFLAEWHAGRNFHYVTGSRTALASVWRRYHVAALPGPAGTVSHNAFSVLVDPQGRERFLLDSQLDARDVLAAMN
jgi:protein SCO1/2